VSHQLYPDHITSRCTATTTFENLLLGAFDSLNPYYSSETSIKTGRSIKASLGQEYFKVKSSIEAAFSQQYFGQFLLSERWPHEPSSSKGKVPN
jgi:hypothetical protein